MFNREYQRRAARQALGRVGAALERDESHFYRPARRLAPGRKCNTQRAPGPEQLELFAEIGAQQLTPGEIVTTPVKNFTPDSDRPLADLFPEAYQ
jgi:hypothetical protein